jgi:hypothetical protein
MSLKNLLPPPVVPQDEEPRFTGGRQSLITWKLYSEHEFLPPPVVLQDEEPRFTGGR